MERGHLVNKTSFRRGIPFTLLPNEFFDPESTTWHDAGSARWSCTDDVTLGESRAVLKFATVFVDSTLLFPTSSYFFLLFH